MRILSRYPPYEIPDLNEWLISLRIVLLNLTLMILLLSKNCASMGLSTLEYFYKPMKWGKEEQNLNYWFDA